MKTDICIIGGGVAGLTFAIELLENNIGKKICIVDAGGEERSKYSDELKKIKINGEYKFKKNSREFRLGGCSTTWGGACAPLEASDLENKSFNSLMKWPITFEELETFYKKIDAKYGLPLYDDFFIKKKHMDIFKNKDNLTLKQMREKSFFANVEAPNFYRLFEKKLKEEGVIFITETIVTELYTNNNGERIEHIKCINTNTQKSSEIFAEQFVLAANTIENTRILLSSKSFHKNGIGNDNNMLGKCYMDHPKNYFGEIKLYQNNTNLSKYWGFMYNEISGFTGLRASSDSQKELSMLNSYLRLAPKYLWDENKGVESFVELGKYLKSVYKFWRKSNNNKIISMMDYSETGDIKENQSILKHFFNILFNIHIVLIYAKNRLVKNKISFSKLGIRNIMEIEPNIDNYLSLSDKKDKFGRSIPILNFRYSNIDKKTIIQLHQLINKEMKINNIGEVCSAFDENDFDMEEASHHMGTTRMGEDVKTSVVDKNLKVHDIDNLYISGASVFPTSGSANPTYTIIALSIRLAEHLKRINK